MQGASQKSILVVEDDAATAGFLLDNLRADGFVAWSCSGAAEALRALELRHPDLLLLDLGLESGSGLDVLDRGRSADAASSRGDPDMPVIVLTARAAEAARARGCARGADGCLCKPFSYPELVARVTAVLRRSAGRRSRGVVRVGELTVDPSTRAVQLGGRSVRLSAKEF